MKSLNIVNAAYRDLNPRVYGFDHCPAGRAVSTREAKFTMIHYVEKGKGALYKNGMVYEITPGKAFIINKGEEATYTADKNDPWFYRYISFDGELADDFKVLPTVFETSPDFFRRVCDVANMPCKRESRLAALLFEWHSELCAGNISKVDDYSEAVIKYVNENYMLDISVGSIAEELYISRGYLGRCFKAATGKSVQDYIIEVRISHAKKCLMEKMTVTECASSCGFGDTSNFSKLFKKYTGVSPLAYRKHEFLNYTNNTYK